MAVSLPTAADVRKARKDAKKLVDEQIDHVRTPLRAWVGAGDLAYSKITDAVDKARDKAKEGRTNVTDQAEKLQDKLGDLRDDARDNLKGDEVRRRYHKLADRGETAVEKFKARPRVKRVLDRVSDANSEFDKRVEEAVDKLHDAGEDLRDRVRKETRSAGDEAAATTAPVTPAVAKPTAPVEKPAPAAQNGVVVE